MTKYVFVTGGVVSGLGKGITASSIALLLKAQGYKIFMQKFDPYINVDPGLMSPLQHGEVFVTADGSETDLDLGHYERFIDEELNYSSSISTGKIFSSVIEKERRGEYGGGTVQIVPHITNEIKNRIYEASTSSGADIVITEIGGTVGDIESQAVLEAIRQIRNELGIDRTAYVHMTLIPHLFGSGELKTKPTQHSVMDLRSLGIQPDFLICRTPYDLTNETKDKISLFCSIPANHVLSATDVKNIYQIPLNLYEQKIDELILKIFNLPNRKTDLSMWNDLINKVESMEKEINVAVVGKYVEGTDAYISTIEALRHAGYQLGTKINISLMDIKNTNSLKTIFKNIQGIVIPYGTANQEIIDIIEYARTNNIPFFGIDLGFQMAIVEFARNVCKLEDATSREMDELSKVAVIDYMSDIKNNSGLKGNRRIGNYKCLIKKGTFAYSLYKEECVLERHRNRYEFNINYLEMLEKHGMVISGTDELTKLAEIVELPNHPFFVACQFRPEFKSRPIKSHPLFSGFVKAILKQNKK